MDCCLFSRSSEDPNVTEVIRAERKKFEQEKRRVRLLLLGIGESGKSTVSKQMELLHRPNEEEKRWFSAAARSQWKRDILKNIVDTIVTIVSAFRDMGLPLSENPEIQERAVQLSNQWSSIPVNELPEEFFDFAAALWADECVSSNFYKLSSYLLIDSARYFLENLSRIRCADFVPTDHDILRCRVMTVSISELRYEVKDPKTRKMIGFSVFDVGGQRGERRKWLPVFDNQTTAIIFVADCSCFDLTLREDLSQNRLIETLQTFHSVWNNRYVIERFLVLYAPIDLLAEKIKHGSSLRECTDLEATFKINENQKELTINIGRDYANFRPKDAVIRDVLVSWRDLGKPIDLTDQQTAEFVRSLCFIKHLFQLIERQKRTVTHLEDRILGNVKRGFDWHHDHRVAACLTCAINTNHIRLVLDACRNFFMEEAVRHTGIL